MQFFIQLQMCIRHQNIRRNGDSRRFLTDGGGGPNDATMRLLSATGSAEVSSHQRQVRAKRVNWKVLLLIAATITSEFHSFYLFALFKLLPKVLQNITLFHHGTKSQALSLELGKKWTDFILIGTSLYHKLSVDRICKTLIELQLYVYCSNLLKHCFVPSLLIGRNTDSL